VKLGHYQKSLSFAPEDDYYGSGMRIFFTAIRALIFGGSFVTAWTWIALIIRDRYDADVPVVFPEWISIAGLVLIAAGGLLALTCVGVFVILGKGTAAPFDPPKRFVAVGPYRVVRNPMYVGAFFAILGFGLFLNSLAVLLFGLLSLLWVHGFVALYEEPTLRKKFGEEYDAYCRTVNRWKPKVP
jgi:protein-S-isoprenylcysteine O-methyltransferase Ste14